MGRILRAVVSWLIALYSRLLGATCRFVPYDDPRPALRACGERYIYGCLHAHQVAAMLGHGEARVACILSRSADGDLIARAMQAHRITPIRGSSRHGDVDKGGRAAMQAVIDWVETTGAAATLTIDGPRGPRNAAKPGLASIAVRTNAAVVTAVCIARRRWILRNTWDRFQIPRFFTRIDNYFDELRADNSIPDERERIADLSRRIEASLRRLEESYDGAEYAFCQDHVRKRQADADAASGCGCGRRTRTAR